VEDLREKPGPQFATDKAKWWLWKSYNALRPFVALPAVLLARWLWRSPQPRWYKQMQVFNQLVRKADLLKNASSEENLARVHRTEVLHNVVS